MLQMLLEDICNVLRIEQSQYIEIELYETTFADTKFRKRFTSAEDIKNECKDILNKPIDYISVAHFQAISYVRIFVKVNKFTKVASHDCI